MTKFSNGNHIRFLILCCTVFIITKKAKFKILSKPSINPTELNIIKNFDSVIYDLFLVTAGLLTAVTTLCIIITKLLDI